LCGRGAGIIMVHVSVISGVKAWHVKTLDFSETLDTFEDSGATFNKRCGLE
jgi:hypothetical protein